MRILAILLLSCAHARAEGTPMHFLLLDSDARAAALGGAYTALAEDPNALQYNPAGLARQRRHEAVLMHNEHFAGISHQYGAYASPWGLGVAFSRLDSGPVRKTTISDPDGAALGDAALQDLSVSAGYGRSIIGDLSLGASGKLLRESIDGTSAKGFALDLGALYSSTSEGPLAFGAAIRNLGGPVRFQKDRESLPLELRAGLAWRLQALGGRHVLSLDASRTKGARDATSAGWETALGALALRAGYSSRNQAGPGFSIGFGCRLSRAGADYAFIPFGDLGTAHRMSLTFAWGPSRDGVRTPVLNP